ncbi:hypothetical protein [Negativibacillus massiliensis]|uniref:hypothetical protein n=1 Tax=Negativibacillus massiliensis TaxID=1871035 RepID=UPI00097780F1|nr:hypothetical protein [Negativibacillus massiliensis]
MGAFFADILFVLFLLKMFHSLQRATKGKAFENRELFVEKQVENKCSTTETSFFYPTTRLCAIGEWVMFYSLLKAGFAFIAPKNIVSLHSLKDCGEAEQGPGSAWDLFLL